MFFLTLLFAACLLLACDSAGTSDTAIYALVVEGDHYSMEVGQVSLEPGKDASFYIDTEEGYTVTSTDYRGEYTLTQTRGLTKLELKDVQYPTRVHLTLSHSTRRIDYDANGGEALTGRGTFVTEQYDVSLHIRPNVSIGTDLFTRDGYTLVCWNTEPDGSGLRVGLGSRMTVDDSAVLYAQWAEWSPSNSFICRLSEGNAIITGYNGTADPLVIPEQISGCTVTGIDANAFSACAAKTVILPKSIVRIEDNAFAGAQLSEIVFCDNVEYIADKSFSGCKNLSTVRINAIEDPYGYKFRRESVFADKMDVLITTMGENRMLFYAGCSMWYNLIGSQAAETFGAKYRVLNMAINGVASSLLQMELIRNFVTEKDILIHAPEISSMQQLLTYRTMYKHDDKLWCAIEYNYDLFALVDIRVFDGGVFDSLKLYLDKKKPGGKYTDEYHDSKGRTYLDETLSIPYIRTEQAESLVDDVELDPKYLDDLSYLEYEYGLFAEKGVRIYVTFAVVDIDDVPKEQQENALMMGNLFLQKFSAMKNVTVFGKITDFIYHDGDFYDTVYHLLTEPAKKCTRIWLRDLKEQMIADGIWREGL